MAYRKLPGQATGPSREPERVQPVPEHYQGVNFPYRGTEQHGVAVPDDAHYNTRDFQYPEEEPEKVLPAVEEHEPIPVRIVNTSARERLDMRVARFRVTERAQQILGRLDTRKGVRIKVLSQTDGVASNPIYIGHDDSVKTYTGYEMTAGETIFPITTTEDIYAICAAGQTVEIAFMYEFSVPL